MNWTPEEATARANRMPELFRGVGVPGAMVPATRSQPRIRGVAPKEQRTYNGVIYQSKAESTYAGMLDLLVKAGSIASWRRQVRFPIEINKTVVCDVVVDFQVVYPDGKTALIEVKGHCTEVYTLKAKLFAAAYPALKIVVIPAGEIR